MQCVVRELILPRKRSKVALIIIYVFLFSLSLSTLPEVCVGISSQVKYSLQAFWAVSIRELHISLWRPWTELQADATATDRSIVERKHYQHLALDIR